RARGAADACSQRGFSHRAGGTGADHQGSAGRPQRRGMSTLLLSDLHLPQEDSPLRQGFARFLAGPARQAEAVYILGDLFEYWIGDDFGLRDHPAEAQWLRTLADSGVRVYLMHGNRDFMIGKRFARAAGL